MFNLFRKLAHRVCQTHPIPGLDWKFWRYCTKCGHGSGHATHGGPHGQQHCYVCGHRSEPPNLDKAELKRCVSDSQDHWRRHPIIPYNWHLLSEKERWKILGMPDEKLEAATRE